MLSLFNNARDIVALHRKQNYKEQRHKANLLEKDIKRTDLQINLNLKLLPHSLNAMNGKGSFTVRSSLQIPMACTTRIFR